MITAAAPSDVVRGTLIGVAVTLVLTLIVADLSYRFVELPFLHRRAEPSREPVVDAPIAVTAMGPFAVPAVEVGFIGAAPPAMNWRHALRRRSVTARLPEREPQSSQPEDTRIAAFEGNGSSSNRDRVHAGSKTLLEGIRLERKGDLAGAEAAYLEVSVQGGRAAPSAELLLGRLLERRGELDQALAAYRVAASGENAVTKSASFFLARLLESRGQPREAEAAYTVAASADGRVGGSAAYFLGGLLEQRGELARAEAAYRQAALAQTQVAGSAASSLGRLLEQRGEFKQAEAACRAASQPDGRVPAPAAFLLDESSARATASAPEEPDPVP